MEGLVQGFRDPKDLLEGWGVGGMSVQKGREWKFLLDVALLLFLICFSVLLRESLSLAVKLLCIPFSIFH